jgi:hypothetical protein
MQTEQPNLLTDTEVVKALWTAHIPSGYHKKNEGLKNLNDTHRELAEAWLPNARLDASLGKTLECRVDGVAGMDVTYYLARALVLKGIGVMVLTLPRLASLLKTKHEARSSEALENMAEMDYLFVLGAMGQGSNPYENPLAFEIEWLLRNWMMSNKALYLQGESNLDLSDWWSAGFRNIFNDKKVLTFETGSVRLPKSTFAKVANRGAVR